VLLTEYMRQEVQSYRHGMVPILPGFIQRARRSSTATADVRTIAPTRRSTEGNKPSRRPGSFFIKSRRHELRPGASKRQRQATNTTSRGTEVTVPFPGGGEIQVRRLRTVASRYGRE